MFGTEKPKDETEKGTPAEKPTIPEKLVMTEDFGRNPELETKFSSIAPLGEVTNETYKGRPAVKPTVLGKTDDISINPEIEAFPSSTVPLDEISDWMREDSGRSTQQV